MKKLLLSFILIGVWSLSCGFSSAAIGAFNYSNGKVGEFVEYEYTQETADAFGKTITQFETDLAQIQDATETLLKNLICAEIDNNTDLTDAQKDDLKQTHIGIGSEVKDGYYRFYVSFSSVKVQNLFCGDIIENAATKTEKSLFTVTQYSTYKPKLAQVQSGGQKVYLYDIITTKLTEGLVLKGYDATAISENMPSTFSYTYTTTVKRIHSNAKEKAVYDAQSGLYYHTWVFDSTDSAVITLWQTRANPVAWYVLALGFTAILAVVLVVYAHRKKKYEEVEKAVFDIFGDAGVFDDDYDYYKVTGKRNPNGEEGEKKPSHESATDESENDNQKKDE